jgi:hypothetical protein
MILSILRQPDVNILGIRLQEPITTFTDLLVTVVCFYAYWKVNKSGISSKAIQYIKYYFILMGTGIAFGGLIGHGFQYAFSPAWKCLGWVIGMFAVLFFEFSALEYTANLIPPKWHKILVGFSIIEIVIALAFTISFVNFKYVQYHMIFGFIVVVFSLHLLIYYKTNDHGSRWIMAGVAMLVIAISAFSYRVTPHIWFNHNDLSHVIIALATYLFLKGALHLGEPPKEMAPQKSVKK